MAIIFDIRRDNMLLQLMYKAIFELTNDRADFVFAGDSPNDQPMFAFFPNAVGVANVSEMADMMTDLPAWVPPSAGSHGFAELAEALLPMKG